MTSKERFPLWNAQAVAVFSAVSVISAVILGPVNFVVSAIIDYRIAEKMGGVTSIPFGESIFGGGLAFGGIDWSWSSVFGPLMGIFGGVGMLVGFALTGIACWLFVSRVFVGEGNPFARYGWLLGANVALWLLRFPVPTEYSLFYWTAIKF